MMVHHISIVAVLVAAVASFLIGGLWYSPVLFANAWMKALGKTKEDMQNNPNRGKLMMTAMVMSFVQALIVAIAMAHFFNITKDAGLQNITMALETAVICWFAFVFMIALVTRTYEQSNITLFYLHVGYRLVEFIAIALIVFYIR